MDLKEYKHIIQAVTYDVATFPDCRIANCKCNSKNSEWKVNCGCFCHFTEMDVIFGKDEWDLEDFNMTVKIGYER